MVDGENDGRGGRSGEGRGFPPLPFRLSLPPFSPCARPASLVCVYAIGKPNQFGVTEFISPFVDTGMHNLFAQARSFANLAQLDGFSEAQFSLTAFDSVCLQAAFSAS